MTRATASSAPLARDCRVRGLTLRSKKELKSLSIKSSQVKSMHKQQTQTTIRGSLYDTGPIVCAPDLT